MDPLREQGRGAARRHEFTLKPHLNLAANAPGRQAPQKWPPIQASPIGRALRIE
jgi:hypothetical protein